MKVPPNLMIAVVELIAAWRQRNCTPFFKQPRG